MEGIYSYTAFLHGILAILSLASLVYLAFRKKYDQPPVFNSYFNWFLFFFLYNISLLFPLLIFDELNLRTALAYNIGLLFLGIAMWEAFRVGLTFTIPNERSRAILTSLYLIGTMEAVVLHFIFPEAPRGTPDGKWVLWYSNESISLFYILFAFVAGWLYAIRNLLVIKVLSSTLLKVRATLFGVAGFMLPFAAYYYFGVQEVWEVKFSLSISILGLTLFAVGNIMGLFKTWMEKYFGTRLKSF